MVFALTDRVIVFIDYQNTYAGAREAFHSGDGRHVDGQFDPRRLGEVLTARGLVARSLAGVRIYRGLPDAHRDPRGYSACSRQCERWRRQPDTTVITRALLYPRGWPKQKAREKGVDVALAIDFAAMAVRGEYDVGILVSVDTDLKPALEFISALPGPTPRCEVAAWSEAGRHSRRLSLSARKIWCHWLSQADYRSMADTTNYASPPDPDPTP